MNILTNKWNYYNDINPEVCEWVKQLIKMNLVPDGYVDNRSIVDVQADELRGFVQYHLFCGILGWSRALRLSEWPDDKPVWTASLPCQPFSAAGKQLGKDDERHLLPHFLELVKACKPSIIFGEQVDKAFVDSESKIAKSYRRAEPGTQEPPYCWASDLQANMETQGYDVGLSIVGAHSAGGYHQRQRIYWVANANNQHGREQQQLKGCAGSGSWNKSGGRSGIDGVAYMRGKGLQKQQCITGISQRTTSREPGENVKRSGRLYAIGCLQHTTGKRCRKARNASDRQLKRLSLRCPIIFTLGDTEYQGYDNNQVRREPCKSQNQGRMLEPERSSSEWDNPDWIWCRDDKYRPIHPRIKPLVVRTIKSTHISLANGLPGGVVHGSNTSELQDCGREEIDYNNTQEARKMRLIGYGNAIVTQVAAKFVAAFMTASKQGYL